MTDKWQPIETAPEDGTWVIVFWDGKSRLAKWLDNSASEFGSWQGWVVPSLFPRPYAEQPTHWQALPAPPQEDDGR